MTRTPVVLADDHDMFREAVRTLIDHQPDLEVVGEAGTGPEVLDRAKELQPRVLCLDVSMPGWGLGVTVARVLSASPKTRVLILTMHNDPAFIHAAVTAGACGYVVKTASMTDLLSAVRAVAAGERVFPPLTDTPAPSAGEPQTLSRREREVLELLAHGLTHQEVADRLFLSVKTVETYRARVRTKMGLHTRADFVRYGVENGLLHRPGVTPTAGDS